jgi:capsular polysaccharide biosynthesis protein
VEQAELAESLESAQQGGQVSILDEAAVPSAPTRSRSLVLMAGLVLTGAFALGVAVLLELVDPIVIGARQIEDLSGRPVLGAVPHVAA